MRYDFVCPDAPEEHPVVEIRHSIKEEHPVLHCEICGEVLIRKYGNLSYAGRAPDPPGMIQAYLNHNWKRKRAGLSKFSPHKIKRPPE